MTGRFERLTAIQMIAIIGLLAMLPTFQFPKSAAAQTAQNKTLVFEIKNLPTIPNVDTINDNLTNKSDNNDQPQDPPAVDPMETNVPILQDYLEKKGSPLAPYAEHILNHENWKLVLAISNGESTMCKRQMYNNCWGVGGAWNLKRYSSFQEGFTDVSRLLAEKYVAKGADTPSKIVNRYVGHPSANWVIAVNQILKQLDQLPLQN